MIFELDDIENKFIFLSKDENGREIKIYNLNNCKFLGDLYYPNPILSSNNINYRIIREKIMSLEIEKEQIITECKTTKSVDFPVFFFIYNTDNYYHFIYDTLPYLISFMEIRKTIPTIKLLMNYPNSSMNKFYRFINEFLEILNIDIEKDILIIDKETLYKNVYVSSSYTHDDKSNKPPRKEIFKLYKEIVDNVVSNNDINVKNLPKKIYISRRTWINNDVSNIGTNYTSRRKLMNEDQLVDILNKNGYIEIFTENLSTTEKILMFNNADSVVGAIGGGVCNVLFCKPETKVLVLVSPTFLDINSRFKYSLDCCDTTYYGYSSHNDEGEWKKYMRVSIDKYKIVGEIEEILDSKLIVSYSNQNLSGWNNQVEYLKGEYSKKLCRPLDMGLNSPWILDLEKIKEYL